MIKSMLMRKLDLPSAVLVQFTPASLRPTHSETAPRGRLSGLSRGVAGAAQIFATFCAAAQVLTRDPAFASRLGDESTSAHLWQPTRRLEEAIHEIETSISMISKTVFDTLFFFFLFAFCVICTLQETSLQCQSLRVAFHAFLYMFVATNS